MNNKGSILLAVIFTTLVLFAGVTLLTLTYDHEHIVGARTRKNLDVLKISQDLCLCLHNCREKIMAVDLSEFENPAEEYFNPAHFPNQSCNGTTISYSFASREVPAETYKITRVSASLLARDSRLSPYKLRAGANIEMLSGNIPLTRLPGFINKAIDTTQEIFLEKQKVTTADGKKIIVSDAGTQLDTEGFIKDALRIDTPGTINWEHIRRSLGLERSNTPIKEGVYVAVSQNTVTSIIVRGDVQSVTFFILGDRQGITINKDGIDYTLAYIPGDNVFECWDTRIPLYTFFAENILIIGDVLAIAQEGDAAFLESANIKLLVSGLAVITTSLETKRLNLRGDKVTNFTLLNDFPAFPGLPDKQRGVVIDTGEDSGNANGDNSENDGGDSTGNNTEEQAKTRLEASIISSARVTVTRPGSRVELIGSLYGRDLENNGTLEITHMDAQFSAGSYFAVKDFVYISDFWVAFIEEVYNEN